MDLADLRREYSRHGLLESELHPDPIQQFDGWLRQALELSLVEPYAMTLATATPDGVPSARIVLLRGVDQRGLVFFSNYDSRKGRELASNPRAALLFYWAELERQVRIEGSTERVADAESDAYHQRRPLLSRLSAAASAQSEVIPHRETLEQRVAELLERYTEGEVPRPSFWGGTRVIPTTFEFWQGRPNRLHDRLRYRLAAGRWIIERLSP